MIFLTNGFDTRIWNHPYYNERPVSGEVQGFGDVGRLLLLPPLGQLADLFRSRLVESDRSLCRRKGFAVYDHRRAMELAVKWMYAVDKQLVLPYKKDLSVLLNTVEFVDLVDDITISGTYPISSGP